MVTVQQSNVTIHTVIFSLTWTGEKYLHKYMITDNSSGINKEINISFDTAIGEY